MYGALKSSPPFIVADIGANIPDSGGETDAVVCCGAVNGDPPEGRKCVPCAAVGVAGSGACCFCLAVK